MEKINLNVLSKFYSRVDIVDKRTMDTVAVIDTKNVRTEESYLASVSLAKELKLTDSMSFEDALHLMKNNYRLARKGWHRHWQFVALVKPNKYETVKLNIHDKDYYSQGSYLVTNVVNSELVPWAPSQTDILANDWYIATEGECNYGEK